MSRKRPARRIIGLAALALHAAACFLDATGQPQGGHGSEQGGASQSSTGAAIGGAGAGGTAGSSADGGGGTTTSGLGGADCGNGEIEPGEDCDDGGANELFDGCDRDCMIIAADGCASVTPIELAPGDTVQFEGDTEEASNDIFFSGGAAIAGLDCQSDGPDLWYAVHTQSAGAVLITLTVGPGGNWGGSLEKARLELRSGCDAADAGQALACKPTSIDVNGVATLQLFAKEDDVLFILVDGKDANSGGPFTLTVEQFECGDRIKQEPEQCDPVVPSAACKGCLMTTPLNGCGADATDLLSFYLPATEHCYVVDTTTNLNFFEARAACLELGGELASLATTGEKGQFDSLAPLASTAWVGLEDFDQDETYDWLEGGIFAGPWKPDNPDNMETKPRAAWLILDDAATANWADDAACDTDATGFVCEIRGANP
jgi:hypothetical protein